MAVKLIALDIDGTLLDSRWTLPEANRAAIAEATCRGIEVDIQIEAGCSGERQAWADGGEQDE